MSYKKVSDGGQQFKHSGTMEVSSTRPENMPTPFHLEVPKTYIACPNCKNTQLISCNCWPVNYACYKCSWKHINHEHITKPLNSPSSSNNVNNNSLLSGIIRR